MPIERVSKQFKDISLSFNVNPLNYDLIVIKNETAIARSVRNLVYTTIGERFLNPNLGSNVTRALFDSLDSITANVIQSEIKTTIDNYEPRVNLVSVKVTPDKQVPNKLYISLWGTFEVVTFDPTAQEAATDTKGEGV
jgi:phage baseplate assembly protein W